MAKTTFETCFLWLQERTEDRKGLEKCIEGQKQGGTKWKKNDCKDGKEKDKIDSRSEIPLLLRLTADPESGNTGVSSSEVELGPGLWLHSNEQADNFQLPAALEFPLYTWAGDKMVREGKCLGLWGVRGTVDSTISYL